MANAAVAGSHVWKFFRAGGFDQVRLDGAADIAALDQLDQKLWVALSCPTRGLEFDSRTLDLVDADGDGRIRAPEILAAARWACANLRNPDDMLKGADALPLAAINDATDEGRRILASARRTLATLGKPSASLGPGPDAAAISVADAAGADDPAVERLARYCRDLYQLLNNFVAFADFYSRRRKAVFQAGTLYLDGRSCELCVRVDDPAKHAALASHSKTYLAYCDCTRKGAAEKATIAAAFTAGDSDRLMVGRNGVFYDRKGQDWDATIVRLVEHPISIRQAVWAPYKRIARTIGEQIEKFAAERDKAVADKAAGSLGQAPLPAEPGKPPAPAAPAPAPTAPAPFDIAKFAGIFAAIGLALGAIGTALAAIVAGFLRLAWWQMPLLLLGIFALISGPSVIIAWLKLRQRNLGPLLDACGWAVNARVKINIPFGRTLTAVAKLPPNAQRSLTDPYAQRSPARWLIPLLILLALAGCAAYWYFGHYRPWKARQGAQPEAPQEPPPR